MHLIVTAPFADYVRGDRITDTGDVARILAGPQSDYVVRVIPPDDPPGA